MTDEELLAIARQHARAEQKRHSARERKKTKRMRAAMAHQGQVKRCHYCRCLLTMATATLEHLIPISKGGRTESSNCRWACKPCNNQRGNGD